MKRLFLILFSILLAGASFAQNEIHIGNDGRVTYNKKTPDTVYIIKEVPVKDNNDDVFAAGVVTGAATAAVTAVVFDFIWHWDGYHYYRYPVRPYRSMHPYYWRGPRHHFPHHWRGPAYRSPYHPRLNWRQRMNGGKPHQFSRPGRFH